MIHWFNRLKEHHLVTILNTHYQTAEVDLSSIAVAYYLLLTLFPVLVLVANSFPYLNINTTDLLAFLAEHLPAELYDNVSNVVVAVLNTPSTGLVWFSVVTGLWTMSRGFFFLQKAVNKAYDHANEQRDIFLGRLFGAGMGILLIVSLAVAVLLSILGKTILSVWHDKFHLADSLYQILLNLLQPAVFLVFILVLAVLYYVLPNVRITKKRYVLPGTLFTSLVLGLTSNLFATYVNQTISRMENLRVLGSVAVFALMLWFIMFAKVMIIGAVFNASYQVYREDQLVARRGTVRELVNGKKEE